MVNRKTKLFDLLGSLWASDMSYADVLHYCTQFGFARCVVEPQIKSVFAQWEQKYAEYNATQDALLSDKDRGVIYALN